MRATNLAGRRDSRRAQLPSSPSCPSSPWRHLSSLSSTASAIWNTRKGVAFALAGQSKERLERHAHKLSCFAKNKVVATLYRYFAAAAERAHRSAHAPAAPV